MLITYDDIKCRTFILNGSLATSIKTGGYDIDFRWSGYLYIFKKKLRLLKIFIYNQSPIGRQRPLETMYVCGHRFPVIQYIYIAPHTAFNKQWRYIRICVWKISYDIRISDFSLVMTVARRRQKLAKQECWFHWQQGVSGVVVLCAVFQANPLNGFTWNVIGYYMYSQG